MKGASTAPRISVVVPAGNAARYLDRCLDALLASSLPRADWELIVVDDASTDDTPAIAVARADRVITVPGSPRGPAYARNRSLEACRGEILVFVDPCVAVHPDALARLVGALDADLDISAVSGRWDWRPTQGGLAAGYRLLCQSLEQRSGDTTTFWAGLGAVRASVFSQVGPFDEWHYPCASVEDREFGHRMRLAGLRIVRVDAARATSLDTAGLRAILFDDLRRFVVPETRLALHVGIPAVPGRRLRARLSGVFSIAVLLALASVVFRSAVGPMQVAALAFLGLVAVEADLLFLARRARGARFMVAIVPLLLPSTTARAVAAVYAWFAHHLVGPPRVPIDFLADPSPASDTSEAWPPRPVRPERSVWAGPPRRAARSTRRVVAAAADNGRLDRAG